MEKHKCPHCSGNSIKAGKARNGDQRYRCKKCYKYHKDNYKLPVGQVTRPRW